MFFYVTLIFQSHPPKNHSVLLSIDKSLVIETSENKSVRSQMIEVL